MNEKFLYAQGVRNFLTSRSDSDTKNECVRHVDLIFRGFGSLTFISCETFSHDGVKKFITP